MRTETPFPNTASTVGSSPRSIAAIRARVRKFYSPEAASACLACDLCIVSLYLAFSPLCVVFLPPLTLSLSPPSLIPAASLRLPIFIPHVVFSTMKLKPFYRLLVRRRSAAVCRLPSASNHTYSASIDLSGNVLNSHHDWAFEQHPFRAFHFYRWIYPDPSSFCSPISIRGGIRHLSTSVEPRVSNGKEFERGDEEKEEKEETSEIRERARHRRDPVPQQRFVREGVSQPRGRETTQGGEDARRRETMQRGGVRDRR